MKGRLALLAAVAIVLSLGTGTPARVLASGKQAVVAVPAGCGMIEASASRAGSNGSRVVRRAPAAREGGPVAGRVFEPSQSCEACESWSVCLDALGRAGASTQVVPLKNGIMYVYTADSPAGIHVVQAAVAQHQDRLDALSGRASRDRLCPGCRALRAAAARGKLSHEVLNIDGGCIMVTTSTERAVVEKIFAEAGVASTPRVKS